MKKRTTKKQTVAKRQMRAKGSDYKAVVSVDAVALLKKEGITNNDIEWDIDVAMGVTRRFGTPPTSLIISLQTRDLLAQILLELRKQSKSISGKPIRVGTSKKRGYSM